MSYTLFIGSGVPPDSSEIDKMKTLKTFLAKALIAAVSLLVAVAFIACMFVVFVNPVIAVVLLVVLYFVTVKTFEVATAKLDAYL